MPKLAYLVPNYQNPSGVSLSTERRLALLAAAERFGFLIIEDNPYGEIRFEGEALPHLASLDRSGHVLYMGSFSKQFLPGVRLGWLVGDPKLIQRLVVAKQATDLCTNSFGQRLVIECERRNLLDAHIPVLAAIYKRKRDAMLAALAAHFPAGVRWTHPKGGFFIFVTLPEGMDAKQLLPAAVAEEHVAYVSGGAFFVDGTGANTIRMCYSQADDDRIEEGIRRLGRFLSRRITSAPAVEAGAALTAVGLDPK